MPAPILWRYTYRAQLDRVRRMRARFDDLRPSTREAEDIMWSFFQHCWHLNDWLFADAHWKPSGRQDRIELVDAVKAEIKRSGWLQTCRGIANATKHLEREEGQTGPDQEPGGLARDETSSARIPARLRSPISGRWRARNSSVC